MPYKEDVIVALHEHLNALLERPGLMNAPKDVYWTGPVKTAICEACAAIFPGPLRICANGLEKPALAQQGEWQLDNGRRYDIACFTL